MARTKKSIRSRVSKLYLESTEAASPIIEATSIEQIQEPTKTPGSLIEAGVAEVEKQSESPTARRTSPNGRKTKNKELAATRQALLKAASTAALGSQIVDQMFKEDSDVQKSFSKNITARTKTAIPNAVRAEAAFKGFRPSQFTEGDLQTRRYVAPGKNPANTMAQLIKDDMDRLRQNDSREGLRVVLTENFKQMLKTSDDGIVAQMIDLSMLLKILAIKLPSAPTLRDDPALTECAADLVVQHRLDEIEGKTTLSLEKEDNKSKSMKDQEPSETDKFVAKHVHDLLANVPSPEQSPVLIRPAAADYGQVKQNIQNFELRSGPSDVTSYHDFNSLQIAFEHVWSEVFDDHLSELGREFYHAYIDVLDFVGKPVDPTTGKPIEPPDTITSIQDIQNLIQNASMLGRVINNATPVSAPPKGFLDAFLQARQTLINLFAPFFGSAGLNAATNIVDTALNPLKSAIDQATAQPGKSAQDIDFEKVLPAVKRLTTLLERMRDLLKTRYSFKVYHEGACNFGILVTYRQTWVPEQYQVGDLVSTIPLAPRETRRYTTKQVTKRSRAVKEVANNLNTVRTDIDTTGRADRDIVSRAENRTNFKVTADGTFGTEAYKIHTTADGGGDSAKISETTKKDFHEAVLKSAHEYKHENRMEVDTSTSEETETTSYNEIQNPNDELTVTYLFYELQRTYHISERIHQVSPVVLVANRVPAPHEIDDAWLIEHDWILRRVLLDDSFRSALEYLTKSFIGDELNLQVLNNNVEAQRQVVEVIKAQVAAQLSIAGAAQSDLKAKMDAKGGLEFVEGFLGTVKNIFDPLHLTGQSATGTKEGADTIAAYAQEVLDRAEREKIRLLDQLGIATTALQAAVDKLAVAMKEHYDKVAEVDRLRLHVKENILYYMQAIWNHEPPDQRYFRVFEIKVPVPVPLPNSTNVPVQVTKNGKPTASAADALRQRETALIKMPLPEFKIEWKPLVEIADLDEVLGYKGNYAIYRLKENNYLTFHMMQDYLEFSDEFTLRDPDDFANYTVDQLQELATCLYKTKRDLYDAHKQEIKQWMIDRLISGRPEDDRVIVPTKSLYIEALVGTHPLLEDFKLLHRALDVKKVQGEVRHAELENMRLAARALEGKREDPDIEKKIVIENGQNIVVDSD